MLLFWFFVFVCCAVKCDDVSNNYYIIEMPEVNIAKDYNNTPFKVYWNVPTKQCKSKKIPFDNLEKFGIIQNQNDNFEGDRITIMYDPGVFPAIFKGDSGQYRYRNGGVPQEGNLELHLTAFRESLNKSIPNPDFSGVGIIDFESWRPIFRQQFGTLTPYIDLSMNIERQRHWWWPTSWQKMEATKRFEDAARIFMQATLSVAKLMRPRAVWGYYAFPYCFNMGANNMVENCSNGIRGENNKIFWLWAESTALYPSVYSSSNLSTAQLAALVRGRVTEANRVKKSGALVLPYFWFKYRDAGFMSEEDVKAVFEALRITNASGLIIWGSSNDVNQVDKCEQLYNYVETILGPIIQRYLQKFNRNYDDTVLLDVENEENSNDTSISASDVVTTILTATLIESNENVASGLIKTGIDQEATLLPQKNDSEDLSYNIEQEQSKKDYNINEDNKINSNTFTESALWDIETINLNISHDGNNTQIGSENLNQNDAESYFKIAPTTEILSDYSSSVKNDVVTTEMTLAEKHLTNGFELENDDIFLTSENTSSIEISTVGTTNFSSNENNNDDDYLMTANFTFPVISSVNVNETRPVIDIFTGTSTDSTDNYANNDKTDDLVTLAINLT